MKIILKLKEPINGYWDEGAKSKFEFEPENPTEKTLRWESWEANFWFTAKAGKTPKLSIKYALQRLKKFIKKYNPEITTEI